MSSGGAERVMSILVNNYSIIKENEVVLLTLLNTNDDYVINKSVKRYILDKKKYSNKCKLEKYYSKLSLKGLLKMYKILKDEKPDVIVSFLPEPSFKIMFLKKVFSKISKIPAIVSIRNDPQIEYKNKLTRFIMKKLYNNIDGMVFQTLDAKGYITNLINIKNVAVIPNPINEKFFVKAKDDSERKNEIITLGRLENQKNHKLLIKSFYNASKINNKYTLNIYGEGSLHNTLQRMIVELKLEDKVFLRGKTNKAEEVLNDAKIFVLSSDYEGMPNALMEAMACGLPCISTNCPCGGPKEIIINDVNGLLINTNCEEELSNSLIELMERKEKRIQFGNKAKEIRNIYSEKEICSRWDAVIEKVIK